ncbi:hypothetical protein GW932_04335 [archaeon]|nr:hypothetical protein [archaeon]
MGEERNFSKGVLLFLMLLGSMCFVFAESDTFLEVPNTPPEFNGIIPNFSWVGGNLENVFDLDDYFTDLQGDVLTYSAVNNTNIEVIIDSENMVSFHPIADYIGTEIIYFNAEDETTAARSNDVYLGVGVDFEAPKWFNPRVDKTKIYQNDWVNFSVDWTDNFQLYDYVLSIDFGDGWVTQGGNFSGKVNTSINRMQISAPVGKIVYWKVCARDTSYNEGCSDVQQFSVLEAPTVPDSTGTGDGTGEGDATTETTKDLYTETKDSLIEEKEDFSLDVDSFLVSLKQGTSTTRVFEITNTGTKSLDFLLSLEGLSGIALISETNFSLNQGESKTITIDFKISLTTQSQQYFGSLIISSVTTVVVPLVVDVNPSYLEFEVFIDVLENSEYVKPGKEVFSNITVLNLGDKISAEINLYYAIKDYYGNIYDSGEEVFTLNDLVEFEKNLTIPSDVKLGKYIFYAQVSNEKDIAINSDSFTVGLKFKFEAFVRASFVFISIILLSILSVILTLRYRKQKMKERALNLYVKLNELKELIKEKDYDKAAALYMGIKRIYGEKISENILEDKQKLSLEIEKLSQGIDFTEEEIIEATEKKKEGEEASEDNVEKKENEEKTTEEKPKVESPSEKPKEEVKKEVLPIKKVLPVKKSLEKPILKKPLIVKKEPITAIKKILVTQTPTKKVAPKIISKEKLIGLEKKEEEEKKTLEELKIKEKKIIENTKKLIVPKTTVIKKNDSLGSGGENEKK